LVKSIGPRFAAATVVALLPVAATMMLYVARDRIAPLSAIAAVGMSVGLGVFTGLGTARAWRRRADRLDAIADAISRRTLPSHLLPDELDEISLAERHLLDAADSVVTDVKALNEQREEFEAILRSMYEAVVVTGARREVVMINGAARRLFALQPDADYRGRDFVELCRDPRVQDFIGRAGGTGGSEPITAELSIQTPMPRSIEVSSAPLRQGQPNSERVFVFHDITRLKSSETARADFVSNLTHELRTPLTALYGYAETLAKGVDDRETERRFLGIIERQSRRLARLLDDLISLSDLERGLSPLKTEDLEPLHLLEEAYELMAERAGRQGVELKISRTANLPPIRVDHDRLHQVLINLLDNAIKYTPRGGSVTLEAHTREATNGASGTPAPGIVFSVTDTGEGIPAAHIPRLTERFYRVDRARSRDLGGTGLGLAIVKHIVQMHHGSLKIESRVREGTIVTVWLPLGPAPAVP